MKSVLEYLENSAIKYPEKTAVLDDKEKSSYSELLAISKTIGAGLLEHVTPGEPVAVFMKKSVITLQSFFGIVYAGGFYCLIDPDFPVERINNILSVLQPKVVITAEENREKLSETLFEGNVLIAEKLRGYPVPASKEEGTEIPVSNIEISKEAEASFAKIREEEKPDHPLYCNFTSGSTGTPKGVLVAHDTVISFIDDFTELFNITEKDVIGNQAPFDFDVSVKDIYSAMKVGATLVIIPTAFFRFPNNVMDMLEENKVTTLIWAVSALVLLNRLHEFMYKVPPCINKVLFSGEEMPVKHLNDWMDQYPDATFVNLYGPTEITCNCSYYVIEERYAEGEKIPAGHPYPKKQIWLMNDGKAFPLRERWHAEGVTDEVSSDEVDNPSPTGEIVVTGIGPALGYYNNPEATEKAFINLTLPDGSTARAYKTGDLGYIKGGLLYFAGRADFQIKHNGHRIELEEIERALNSLPEVSQGACVYDTEKYRLVAYYTGTEDKKAILEGLKKKIPEYMIPNVFKFVEDIPLTKNGKVDRKLLKEL